MNVYHRNGNLLLCDVEIEVPASVRALKQALLEHEDLKSTLQGYTAGHLAVYAPGTGAPSPEEKLLGRNFSEWDASGNYRVVVLSGTGWPERVSMLQAIACSLGSALNICDVCLFVSMLLSMLHSNSCSLVLLFSLHLSRYLLPCHRPRHHHHHRHHHRSGRYVADLS